jgi:hypothetical protein
MTFARRLAHVDNIAQQDSAERAFNKLIRTFTTQVEALKRYRTGGEQAALAPNHPHRERAHTAEGRRPSPFTPVARFVPGSCLDPAQSRGGAIEYDHDDDEAEDPSIVRSNLGQQGTSESLLDQAKEKLSDVGSTVSEAAHEAYTEASRYGGKQWATTRRWSGTTGKARKQSGSRLPTTLY